MQIVQKYKELYKAQKYSELIRGIKTLESEGKVLGSQLYVLLGMALHLADGDGELTEVENYLLKAVEINPTNIDALEELGHFYENVMDDSKKAAEYFSRCKSLANSNRNRINKIQISTS